MNVLNTAIAPNQRMRSGRRGKAFPTNDNGGIVDAGGDGDIAGDKATEGERYDEGEDNERRGPIVLRDQRPEAITAARAERTGTGACGLDTIC